MNSTQPTPWEIGRAVETLRAAGVVFELGGAAMAHLHLLSREEAARAIGMSVSWLRSHEGEFPNRVKVPGGDVRIPVSDIEAALRRWRVEFSSPEMRRNAA